MPKDKRQSVTEDVTEIVWILVLYQAGVPAVVIGAVTNVSRETVRVLGHGNSRTVLVDEVLRRALNFLCEIRD